MYFIIERDKRENVKSDFDRKITLIQNIDFRNVVINDININKTNNFIDKNNKVTNTIVTKNEKNLFLNFFDFFVCFVRICSCKLILLLNLTKQRL